MSQPFLSLDLADADATMQLAHRIAPALQAGDVILLDGPIGAGKTHFARSLIQHRLAALGCHEDVPSPTFTLVQVYDAGTEIWHADLYRLSHPDEALELGFDEAFETAICLIEWPDRLAGLVPDTALTLRFETTNAGESRRVAFSGNPAWQTRLRHILDAPDG
ncbi:MAG: tRNA (adenosine(37)-N6)-threonylcarbamoyltransferase complex ATPase subunit type 1 TsaE [Paracoccaceae bacterium]|nr:tRNA (adenosine(37)-N6)-threonylcarbamoyltransferase complex ATPase subunit type 1 TsaE [Paracoccaceae bacterium]